MRKPNSVIPETEEVGDTGPTVKEVVDALYETLPKYEDRWASGRLMRQSQKPQDEQLWKGGFGVKRRKSKETQTRPSTKAGKLQAVCASRGRQWEDKGTEKGWKRRCVLTFLLKRTSSGADAYMRLTLLHNTTNSQTPKTPELTSSIKGKDTQFQLKRDKEKWSRDKMTQKLRKTSGMRSKSIPTSTNTIIAKKIVIIN